MNPHSIIEDTEINTMKGEQASERDEGLDKVAGRCGFYAIISSMQAQFPSKTPPTVNQLREVLKSDSDEARETRRILSLLHEPHDNQSWFLQDHLAVIFKMWAESVGLDMILGILDTKTGQSRSPTRDSTTENTKVLWSRYEPYHYGMISF